MEKLKQREYNNQLLVLIMLFINLIAFLYLLIDGIFCNMSFVPVSILTLCYFICILILYLMIPNFTHNLAMLIIVLSYGIRMVIYPLLTAKAGFYIKNVNLNVYSNMNYAVLLQCYELFCVIIVLVLSSRRWYEFREIDIINDKKYTGNIKKSIIMISIILIIIIIIYPSLLNKFRPIIFLNNNNFNQWKIKASKVKYEIPTILYYLSNWAIKILRIIIVYNIVIFIKEKSKKNNDMLSILISILTIALFLIVITTDDQAGTLYISFVFLLILAKLYPAKQRMLLNKIPILFGSFIAFIFFVVPILRDNRQVVIGYASSRLNAYFGGTVNISAALSMPGNNRLSYLLADTLRSIPLIKGFFTDMSTSTMLFNFTLGLDSVYNSQIIPCIGQGAFYLSFIGAPIFSMMLVYLALFYYRKAQTATDSFGFFIYCITSIFLSVGPVFYNLFLTFALIMEYVLPLLFLYKLFGKKNLNIESGVVTNKCDI